MLGCMYHLELEFSMDICPGVELLNEMVYTGGFAVKDVPANAEDLWVQSLG